MTKKKIDPLFYWLLGLVGSLTFVILLVTSEPFRKLAPSVFTVGASSAGLAAASHQQRQRPSVDEREAEYLAHMRKELPRPRPKPPEKAIGNVGGMIVYRKRPPAPPPRFPSTGKYKPPPPKIAAPPAHLLQRIDSYTHNRDVTNRLVMDAMQRYRSRPPEWIVDKVIYDLERDRR